MGIFSNKRIKTATSKRSNINLSSRVITTNDFGYCLPIFSRETVPGDKFHLKLSSFIRLDAMPVPTFSNIKVINRAFYVKYSSCWRPFDDFYAGRTYYNDGGAANFNEVPYISNSEIFDHFIGNNTLRTEVTANDTWDFIEYGPLSQQYKKYYIFTSKGRKFYTLLCNLGYRINFTNLDKTRLSLLPLLAYCRAYYDYVVPSRYSNTHPLRQYFSLIDWEHEDDEGQISQQLDEFLTVVGNTFMTTYYDNDYFTASWERPDTPSKSNAPLPNIKMSDPSEFEYTSNNHSVYRFRDDRNERAGQTVTSNYEADNFPLSAWQMYALNALYKFGMRRGFGGTKYFERIFAQFGIKLPESYNDRSLYCGTTIANVQISDVTSQANTQVGNDVSKLGDYAGKGIAYQQGDDINVECNDFGQIIVITTILPETGYVQGRNRELQHIDRMSFFQPEFDMIGMQPVRNDELFADYRDGSQYAAGANYGGKPDGIFGFTPMFSEYKRGFDVLSGDFLVNHLNVGLDSYHCFRQFKMPSSSYPLRNNLDFRATGDNYNGNGFNRIFYAVDNNISADHFTCIFDIECNAMRKMASIQDGVEFEHDYGESINVDADKSI